MNGGFHLKDVVAWSLANSETTGIPSAEMRERLLPGDLVKLHFHSNLDVQRGERMWVKTTEITETGYVGDWTTIQLEA